MESARHRGGRSSAAEGTAGSRSWETARVGLGGQEAISVLGHKRGGGEEMRLERGPDRTGMIGNCVRMSSPSCPLLCEHSGQDLTRPRESVILSLEKVGEALGVGVLPAICPVLGHVGQACGWMSLGLSWAQGARPSVGLAMAQRVVGLRLEEGMGRQPCG